MLKFYMLLTNVHLEFRRGTCGKLQGVLASVNVDQFVSLECQYQDSSESDCESTFFGITIACDSVIGS